MSTIKSPQFSSKQSILLSSTNFERLDQAVKFLSTLGETRLGFLPFLTHVSLLCAHPTCFPNRDWHFWISLALLLHQPIPILSSIIPACDSLSVDYGAGGTQFDFCTLGFRHLQKPSFKSYQTCYAVFSF